jgi:hypothetical protein
MIYACLSIQPLHNFIGNYTACISQFFVMNRAKQCKCQAIFGDPFMDWLLIIRICKLVGHLIQLSFFVLSYFVLHANCFDLLSFCYSSWSAILPQLFGCSWLSSQRLQCRCQHPWSTQDMVDDGRVGGRRVVEWSPRGEAGTVTAVDVADMVGTLYRQHFITMDGGLLFLCSCIYVHSSRWHVVCCHINEQTWQFICSCTTSLAFFEQSFYCSSFVLPLFLHYCFLSYVGSDMLKKWSGLTSGSVCQSSQGFFRLEKRDFLSCGKKSVCSVWNFVCFPKIVRLQVILIPLIPTCITSNDW